MKMKGLFLAIAGLAFMGMQSYAQYVSSTSPHPTKSFVDAASVGSEYVTVGSRTPYYVKPDATIEPLTSGAGATMDYSNFLWELGLTDVDAPIAGMLPLKYDGSAATDGENVTLKPWIKENGISMLWDDANVDAGTKYVLRATEHSNPLGGGNFLFGCVGNTTLRDIYVLAKPTLTLQKTSGGNCLPAAGATVVIPLYVTGLGNWEVTYDVTRNGTSLATNAVGNVNIAPPAVTDATVFAVSTTAIPAAEDLTQGMTYDIVAGAYGTYVFTIKKITDRISRKDLNVPAALASSLTYTLYVNPTPVTGPIQHIANL